MTACKPTFPNPSAIAVSRRIDAIEARVQKAQRDDGSLVVGDLRRRLSPENIELRADIYWIECAAADAAGHVAGGDAPIPERLDAAQVQSVFGALIEAKKRIVTQGDQDGSGRIERDEAREPDGGPGLAGHFAREALRGVEQDYQRALAGWRAALAGVAGAVDARQRLDESIRDMAASRCATPQGREAVTWAYRDQATRDGLGAREAWSVMRDNLADANRSLLRHLPLVRDVRGNTRPLLADRDVKRLLGARDLESFAVQARERVEARVGMPYGDWVRGKDLPGAEHLDDEDFARVR